MSSGIYKILNTCNDKFYIGSAVNISKRWKDHLRLLRQNKHHSRKLQGAWNKYGELSFQFFVLEVVVERHNLISREQFWIDELKVVDCGYNMAPIAGNCLGVKHSPESIAKTVAFHLGSKHTEEHKAKISASLMGRKMNPESVRKSVEARRGRMFSQETRLKMSAAAKARGISPEARAKMAAKMRGKKFSQEHRMKISLAVSAAFHKKRQREVEMN